MTDALLEPTAEYPIVEEPAVADSFPTPPASPYGTTKTGSPRRKPGPPKGSPARGGRASRARAEGEAPAPPKKPTPNKPTPLPSQPRDYNAGVQELLSTASGALTGLGLLPGQEAYAADAAVIDQLAPPLGDAAARFAATHPHHNLVGLLDKVLTVGPYAAFGAAVVGGVAQILVNHKILPAGIMGTVSPRLLAQTKIAAMRAKMADLGQQLAEQEALADLIAEHNATTAG